MSDRLTRRRFVTHVTAGVAGSVVASNASSYASIVGANDRLRIGLVGFSERAQDALLPALFAIAAEEHCELAAVSDIWSRRRDEAAPFCETKGGGRRPQVFRNNEELYESRTVDAVIVATADFQHASHGIEAMRTGCDVYIEKPLANTMADARAVLAAADETRRVVQIGTQRRSSRGVQDVRAYLQSGEFGPIAMVELARNANQPARWRRPDVVKALREQDTDWTRFRMTRTRDAWDPRKYAEFRLFWPYSSGIPDQWMVHDIDALHFVTGLHRPRSVTAQGGIYQWQDGRINPDTITVVFEYGPPDEPTQGFQVVFSSRMGNSAGTRELYYSNGGTLNMRDGSISPDGGLEPAYAKAAGLAPRQLAVRSLRDRSSARPGTAARAEIAPANPGADASVVAHLRDWVRCIRSRKAPVADARAGYDHSVALCMTITALHTGRRVTFDETRQDVVTT